MSMFKKVSRRKINAVRKYVKDNDFPQYDKMTVSEMIEFALKSVLKPNENFADLDQLKKYCYIMAMAILSANEIKDDELIDFFFVSYTASRKDLKSHGC